jgi:hypothetical protein
VAALRAILGEWRRSATAHGGDGGLLPRLAARSAPFVGAFDGRDEASMRARARAHLLSRFGGAAAKKGADAGVGKARL